MRYELWGRIDEIADYPTAAKYTDYVASVITDKFDSIDNPVDVPSLFEILDLPFGRYTVYGIEGQGSYYNGPDKPCGEAFSLNINVPLSLYDLMSAAWGWTESNAWPHVDHVWFEYVDIDPLARTITFSMGS
jgi:hypothetical protein